MSERWVSVEGLEDAVMVRHAAARGLVRRTDGRIYILVRWPALYDHFDGRRVRLQTYRGTQFSVHTSEIAEMEPMKGTEDGT